MCVWVCVCVSVWEDGNLFVSDRLCTTADRRAHPFWTEGSTRVLGHLQQHTHTRHALVWYSVHAGSLGCVCGDRGKHDSVLLCFSMCVYVCVCTVTCTDHICQRGQKVWVLLTWQQCSIGTTDTKTIWEWCTSIVTWALSPHWWECWESLPTSCYVIIWSHTEMGRISPHFPCMNLVARLGNQQWNWRDSMRAHLMTPLGMRESCQSDSHSL